MVDKSEHANEGLGDAEGGSGESRLRRGAIALENELSVAADLAYLDLGEQERRAFAESVGRMLEFFAKMDEFPAPSSPAAPAGAEAPANLRPDARRPFSGPDPIEQASEREGRFVGIPNIL